MQDDKNDKFTMISQNKVDEPLDETTSDIELKDKSTVQEETKAKLQEESVGEIRTISAEKESGERSFVKDGRNEED